MAAESVIEPFKKVSAFPPEEVVKFTVVIPALLDVMLPLNIVRVAPAAALPLLPVTV